MLVLCLLLGFMYSTSGLDNGLALTPPMGWMSWLNFGCHNISEDLIKRTADRMAADGYRDAGYEYVIIDDCWLEKERGPDGRMVPDRKKFKSGIKALSDYVHSKKLKFGMYQDIGTFTCAGCTGLKNHEKTDVQTFVEWEIDYLKVDGCNEQTQKYDKVYPALGKLLNESGRPILYSCSWPAYQEGHMEVNYTAIAESCNVWRNFYDVSASWSSVDGIMNWFGDNQDRLVPHAGPGQWNDADMLAVGNPSLSVNQSQVQMAVWAVLTGPLLMSIDLDEIKPEYKEILLNKDVIAVNQDQLGKQGRRVYKSNNLEIWKRELLDDSYALAFVNKKGGNPQSKTFHFTEMTIPNRRFDVQDLYLKDRQVLEPNTNFAVTIYQEGVKFYKFSPKKE